MGKLIQFPIDRLRSRRYAGTSVFSAFGELEALERGQLRLVTGCACVAVLCVSVLQIALG
jgi:hypothetical protein